MKHEIIFTEHYALIVSDEKVEEGSFIYETNVGEVSMVDKWYCEILEKGAKVEPFVKVIAHRPLTDAPILEGVPLLPEFSKKDDVKKIAEKQFYLEMESPLFEELGVTKKVQKAILIGMLQGTFTRGYNKAKETYKYTEEDLRKVIEASRDIRYVTYSEDELIQSLQIKRPKYFECETEVKCTGNNNNGCFLESPGYDCSCVWACPTTSNLQGQTELVGEYIYG
jgi:hypothetical protein